jgi:hypothetical protein
MWGRPVSFVNARVLAEQAEAGSVRFASQVLALDESPARGDRVSCRDCSTRTITWS